MNETSNRTLGQIEGLLPVKPSELLGKSIVIFHEIPAHQRELRADPRNLPHRTRIMLGPEVLDLQVSAVTGTGGEYIGPTPTLSVITKQVAAEARIQQLAHFDTLTGLANRDHVPRAPRRRRWPREGRGLAVLFIDLDGFKVGQRLARAPRRRRAAASQVADRLRERAARPAASWRGSAATSSRSCWTGAAQASASELAPKLV